MTMTLKENFLEHEVFNTLIQQIPRINGEPYEELRTAYSDMSRLVVAWLADDISQMEVDGEFVRRGELVSPSLLKVREAAKEWMTRFGPHVEPRRNGPSFIRNDKFRSWIEKVFGSSDGWETMYKEMSIAAVDWISQQTQASLQKMYNNFGWKIANVRQMRLAAKRWKLLTSSPTPSDFLPPVNVRILVEEYRILRDTPLARSIKLLHGHKCQICGEAILLPSGLSYSEAHHIRPLGKPHNGPDISSNIIVLCPNHHVMCDYGCMNLDLSNLRLSVEHQVGQEFIDYHNKEIAKFPS
jgi:5-methylcytosine-specific restriction endonuclease McrA